MKKSPQDWVIDSLVYAFKNKDNYIGNFLNDEAYKYVLKAFADKYSNSFFDENGKIFNMYWNSFSKENINLVFESIIVTEAALKKVNEILINTTNKTQFGKDLGQVLHLEHLTPMSYSRRKLNSLNKDDIDYASVKECFKYAAIALITKKEAKLLDSKKEGGIVTTNDIEELKKFKVPNEEICEAEKLKKDNMSLKDNGNGLLRLVHLYNKGVTFVNLNNSPIDLDCLVNMLINNNFKIRQYAKNFE